MSYAIYTIYLFSEVINDKSCYLSISRSRKTHIQGFVFGYDVVWYFLRQIQASGEDVLCQL